MSLSPMRLAAICVLVTLAARAAGQALDPCTTASGHYPVQSSPFAGESSGVGVYQGDVEWQSPAARFVSKPKPGCPVSPAGLPLYDSFGWGKLAKSVFENSGGEIYTWVNWDANLGYPRGNRLQLNLASAPAPGDFMCPASTLGGSSLCLLPPGAAGLSTAWNGITRPTLEGVVDLVTGVPLYKTVDLELPLDGAVFRLTRTRAANPRANLGDIGANFDGSDRWWSWVGEGWMAGENPILLIDCNMPDMVSSSSSPVTYLWLDAHHSIPFQRVDHSASESRYEAPARFRARMEHNGERANNAWVKLPTQFDVWLYDGQLHYTFVAVNQDVPWKVYNDGYRSDQNGPMVATSYHQRPTYREDFPTTDSRRLTHDPLTYLTNPGLGIPYYGLCVRIEDNAGHAAETTYSRVKRIPVNDSISGCPLVSEDTLARGQISCIRLKSKDEVRWTLVYVHRRFRGFSNIGNAAYLAPEAESTTPELFQQWGFNAVERIYVFRGDVPAEDLPEFGLVVQHLANPLGESIVPLSNEPDPIEAYNSTHPESALPTNWVYQVRYKYRTYLAIGESGSSTPPLLVKTTIQTRLEQGASEDDDTFRDRVFIYDWEPPGAEQKTMPWLRMVFEDQDLARVRQVCPGIDDEQLIQWQFVPQNEIMPLASIRLETENGGWPANSADPAHPPSNPLLSQHTNRHSYVHLDGPQCWRDSWEGYTVDLAVIGSSATGQRLFRIHRMLVPQVPQGENQPFWPTWGDVTPQRSALTAPYHWRTMANQSGEEAGSGAPDVSKARYIVLVDELPIEHRTPPSSGDGQYIEANEAYSVETTLKPEQISRRTVDINAAGFVLRDRMWHFAPDGSLLQAGGGGLGEEYVYAWAQELFTLPEDSPLRRDMVLTQHRTVGWSAADLADAGDTDGLIEFNTYSLVDDAQALGGKRIELKASGIKRGRTGADWCRGKRLSMYDDVTNTETEIALEFLTPVTNVQMEGIQAPQSLTISTLAQYATDGRKATVTVTRRPTEDAEHPDLAPRERRIMERLVIGPPRLLRPGGDLFYPVEKEWYDANGNALWSASGLVRDPFSPGESQDPLNRLIFTYYDRDYSEGAAGRTRNTVADAEAGLQLPDGGGIVGENGEWPDTSWRRMPESGACNFITRFKYDMSGLTDIYFPTGRRWARRLEIVPSQTLVDTGEFDPEDLQGLPSRLLREHVFNDLAPVSGGYVAMAPGEVTDRAGRDISTPPFLRRKVEYQQNITTLDDINFAAPPFQRLVGAKMAMDSSGRLQQADLLEWVETPQGGQWATVGTKAINDLGECYREQELDGTRTRTTRNPLGQNLRRYVGTEDSGWVIDHDLHGPLPYNMVLVERTEYGVSPHDAWLPTISRKYTDNPGWARDHYGLADSPDTAGIPTKVSYDWRMRAVRTDTFSRGEPTDGTREATSLTYLDHSDRPVMTVSFGRGDIAWLRTGSVTHECLDPTDRDLDAPAPREFFGHTVRPTSLVTMHYSVDGNMTERRTYDLAWDIAAHPSGVQPPYQCEYHYFGVSGQEVFTQSPGQPITTTELDGAGRVKSTRSIAPGVSSNGDWDYELARTDYEYDSDGNTSVVSRWERVVSTADALDATNAVRSRTFNWFDLKKRLVATAELGTEQGGFVAGTNGITYSNLEADTPRFDENHVPHRGACVADAGIPLTIYEYDRAGNRVRVCHPNGAITCTEYTALGRVKKQVENAGAPAAEQQVTEYTHVIGRLSKITAKRTTTASEATQVWYESLIVDDSFAEVSRNNGLISAWRLPDPGSGTPPTTGPPDVTLKYTFQGEVAERIDARGVVFRYRRDDLGRLSSIEVGRYEDGSFVPRYPGSMTPSSGTPLNRIGYVTYAYDPAGRLSDIRTFESSAAGSKLITHNRYTYDQRGQVTAEAQSYGVDVDLATLAVPLISYGWGWQETGSGAAETGYSRLVSMTYPQHAAASGGARTVSLGYGIGGSVDSLLGRMSSITTAVATQSPADPVAQFTYAGVGRRASMTLGSSAVVQDYRLGTETGLLGYDGYGRVADLRYRNSSGSTLFEGRYTYDVSGNRTTARLTQATTTGGGGDNLLSQLNEYDQLDRLTETAIGAVGFTSGVPHIESGTEQRRDVWQLDMLGNWAGTEGSGEPGVPATAGRWSTAPLDPSGNASIRHVVDAQNRIGRLEKRTAEGVLTSVYTRYDEAGNLTFDGIYFYQYDAWSRLLQINRAHLGPIPPGYVGEPGQTPPSIIIDQLVKHFDYDGLGRMVRAESPFPDPDSASSGLTRTERFYYDGIRRIQELVTDPIVSQKGADESPNLALQQAAQETAPSDPNADGAASTLGLEQMIQDNPLLLGGSETTLSYLAREYIWGPGDGPGGVDELLVQYASPRTKPWWVLQDAGGDAAALCDQPSGTSGTARVDAQYTWDAYGSVVTAEHLLAHPYLHAGHKALFVDRLDVGTAPSIGGGETPRLWPHAHAVYQVRNRAYAPSMGRFYQRDPNATAMQLIEASSYHGRGLGAIVAAFSMEDMYGDGASLYQYLGSNPWVHHDALGLFFGYDDLASWTVGGIRGGLEAMVGQYADNMFVDADWAADWSMGDDWHTRGDSSWVNISFAMGFYRGMMEQVRGSFFVDEIEAAYEWVMGGRYSGPARSARRGAKIAGEMASFSKLVYLDGVHVATKFKHPGFAREMVRFEDDVIVAKRIMVNPTNSRNEIAQAKKMAIQRGLVPSNVNWSDYHVHHHWVVGEMQIIKKNAHIAAGHIGRAATWPAEIAGE